MILNFITYNFDVRWDSYDIPKKSVMQQVGMDSLTLSKTKIMILKSSEIIAIIKIKYYFLE